MTQLPPDPLSGLSLRDYAAQLRRGEISAEATTADYLSRIAQLDTNCGAFRMVAVERALDTARAIDTLLRSGTDLGPLMGVPVAIKEIFAVDGLPLGANTELDFAFLSLTEGPFVKKLKRAGCIILGATKTTEFAAATINVDKAMPWNPADPQVKRVCGGSSHGSAAALRAGMCAFSIGTDTGGSVRLPAALCGVFGYKSSVGLWSTDGVFPLSPSMDSIGVFTRGTNDATLILDALEEGADLPAPYPHALRLGRPRPYFEDNCEPAVLAAFDAAVGKLRTAGVEIIDVDLPNIDRAIAIFTQLLFTEFAALIGKERLEANQATIDRVPWGRIHEAIGASAETLLELQKQQRQAVAVGIVPAGVDALITPSAPFQACPVDDVSMFEAAAAWNIRSGQCTRPGNFFGLGGTTIPIQDKGALPIGLQIMTRPGADTQLLALSRTIEAVAGARFQ